jgi:prefoldin subunit 5
MLMTRISNLEAEIQDLNNKLE